MTHDLVENVGQIFIKIQSTREMIINESVYECYKTRMFGCLVVFEKIDSSLMIVTVICNNFIL